MAARLDYGEILIDRNDVYERNAAPVPLPALPVVPSDACCRRRYGLEALHVLSILCGVSWSIVAIETWLLLH